MPARLPQMALALIIGFASGLFSYAIGMPLPWMLGSMMGVTAAALAGAPLEGPSKMRGYVIPIIGVMLGSSITAELLANLGPWVVTIALLPVVLLIFASASYLVYRRVGGYDPTTSFFSSVPGGLNEMMLLGAEAGGDDRKIALAHAARVMLAIFFVAIFFGFVLNVSTNQSGGPWTRLNEISPRDYLILGSCAVFGVPFGKLLRLPAAMIFGPMVLSGIAHVAGWVTVAPPTVFIIAAQVVIGTIIGSRFIGTRLSDLGTDLSLAALATFLMLVLAGILAMFAAWIVDMPLGQVFLSFAPGGLTEMTLLTLAIGQDVAFVSVMHLLRISLVVGFAQAVHKAFVKIF